MDVPIEAYPILCETGKQLLPKIIEFGLAKVNLRYQEYYQIDNPSGVDFRFNFETNHKIEEI